MNEQAEILVSILKKKSKEEKEIDVFQKIAKCTLDVICGNNKNNF
jgi:hypothetical protein